MKRRSFFQHGALATVTVASLPRVAQAIRPVPEPGALNGLDFALPREYPDRRGPKTMLFWDYWKLHDVRGAELVQGKPEWVREATYIDPHTGSSGTGSVYFDDRTGLWRKIWGMEDFYVAESEDGISWRPADLGHIQPKHREKKAPHHVDSLPGEGPSFGWLYLDPVASDGFPYKMAVIQHGARVHDRARGNPSHRWHDLTSQFPAGNRHMFDHIMLVSKDGLSWEQRPDYDWGEGRFFPEEPHMMHFNHLQGRHKLVCRPGLGDRRVALTSTTDFWNWADPRLILAPELADGPGMEFYAMPTFPYGQYFVGLVWASHFSSADGPDNFVLHKGNQDCQISFSQDGEYFVRPTRETFIDPNPLGEIGCHQIRPEGMAVVNDEIRIYSMAGMSAHGTPVAEVDQPQARACVMHRLRRDGFFHFRPTGHMAEFTTRPMAIFGDDFTLNAEAPTGEVRVELRDFRNQPIEGYTFEESIPLRFDDSLSHPMQWRNRRNLAELRDGVVRFSVRFHNAHIYSLRGDYHVVDAHDWRRIQDGLPMAAPKTFGS